MSKKFNPFDMLKPKSMIFSAIKDKLEGTGIIKLVLYFSIENDNYNISVANREGKGMKINITEDEITIIKKLFIKRIISAWNIKYDTPIKAVIVQVNMEAESLELFIQNSKGDVFKFDY